MVFTKMKSLESYEIISGKNGYAGGIRDNRLVLDHPKQETARSSLTSPLSRHKYDQASMPVRMVRWECSALLLHRPIGPNQASVKWGKAAGSCGHEVTFVSIWSMTYRVRITASVSQYPPEDFSSSMFPTWQIMAECRSHGRAIGKSQPQFTMLRK